MLYKLFYYDNRITIFRTFYHGIVVNNNNLYIILIAYNSMIECSKKVGQNAKKKAFELIR